MGAGRRRDGFEDSIRIVVYENNRNDTTPQANDQTAHIRWASGMRGAAESRRYKPHDMIVSMRELHPRQQLLAPDITAAGTLWDEYCAAHPQALWTSQECTVEHFGDSARLSDELLDTVLSGRKRATAELVADFAARGAQVPRIGSHWIACDSTGTPRIIIRSVELRVGPFPSADEPFAADEGEDDGSLVSWQKEHRSYWERVSAARGVQWSEEDEIVFERFAVVWPPEHSDTGR